jgi:transposase
MKLHANAALSWRGRRRLVERVVFEGWSVAAAAAAAGVSVRCARKWVGRFRCEGERGLFDRSSAPGRVANRTADERVQVIVKLRRLRFTAAEIAETLEMALSTLSGILTRLGMGRLGRLGLEPAVRDERSRPGERSRDGGSDELRELRFRRRSSSATRASSRSFASTSRWFASASSSSRSSNPKALSRSPSRIASASARSTPPNFGATQRVPAQGLNAYQKWQISRSF